MINFGWVFDVSLPVEFMAFVAFTALLSAICSYLITGLLSFYGASEKTQEIANYGVLSSWLIAFMLRHNFFVAPLWVIAIVLFSWVVGLVAFTGMVKICEWADRRFFGGRE